MIGWLAVATSLLHAEGARWSSRDGAEAVKAFRPSTARRYPPVGLTGPSSACPACAGCPETKQEKSIRVLSYQARAGPDQKCTMSGRPNELLRRRRLAPRPRGGWAEHPVQCRLASFTDHRTASPLRLRLAVVYAEQPPAASSTNAGGACSAGPSGVGLGRRAGTVASARTKLGRPEERQAERAGAADASTLPPSSRRKVKHWSTTLTLVWG